MQSVDHGLAEVVDRGTAPGCVAMAATSGMVIHAGAHGAADPDGTRPMTEDAVFRVMSCTKVIACAAAMKLVEEGRLDLDGAVEDVLPEFGRVKRLDGFGPDGPRLVAPARKATFRHLMTHASGLVYETWNADELRFQTETGAPKMRSGLREALMSYPLAFEPGEGWGYGPGIDWLGLAVEELAGERIDAFLRREIFAPLGMNATGVECTPDMAGRLVTPARNEDGAFTAIDFGPPEQPDFYGMGHALYSTAPDLLAFLRMLLRGGELDGRRVLARQSVDALFASATGPLPDPVMTSAMPVASADVRLAPGVPKTHTLGAVRVEADVPGARRAGSIGWAGLLNTWWWADPASDLCGVAMMQHLPFADDAAMSVFEGYERAVCAAMR